MNIFSRLILLASLLLAPPVFSAEPENKGFEETVKETAQETSAKIEETAQEIALEIKTSRLYRSLAPWQVGIDFSYLDLVIPGKYGLHVQYLKDADTTYEFSYLKGSFSVPFFIDDLGGITEERFTVIARKFYGTNSFNFFYGLSYFNFHVDLGSEYLQTLSPSERTTFDVVQLQSLGAVIGIGNRWHLHENVVLGVDWIAWSQPLIETYRNSDFIDASSNEGYRDNVRSAFSVLSYLPRLSIVKVQLAWSF